MYVQPLIASAIAWLWLGQVPTVLTGIGGLLAIGGVVLTVGSVRAPVPQAKVVAAPRVIPADCCTQS
jgi:drug/metabolite transporter (DMT)-like permease